MAKTVDFPIVGSYNNQRVTNIDAERSVNCFQYIDNLGKKQQTLINTSGLINTNGDFGEEEGGYRAQFVFNNIEYDVIGSSVFRITPEGVISLIGTLVNTDVGYVGIDANTFQIIFVDSVNGYIWDTVANTFQMITDTSFPPLPLDVCYLDGFFVVIQGMTNQFQLSSFNQGLVWGPASNDVTADDTGGNNWIIIGASTIGGSANTDDYKTGVSFTISSTGSLPAPLTAGTTYYAIYVDGTHIRVASSLANAQAGTAIVLTSDGAPTITILSDGQLQLGEVTSHPGTLVACRTIHRRIFFFSQFFTEVWENQGIGTNLPFRRNNSLLIEFGTPCIGSVAVSFDLLFFLSQSRDGLGPVIMINGTTPMTISTRALDYQYNIYSIAGQISDCRAFLIKDNGLIFYRMNFTAANHTFVYNVSLSDPSQEETRLWHEEEVLDGDRHPSQTHAYLNGINYVGNYESPIRYQVDSQTYTNAGEAIRRMRISKPIVPPGYQRTRIDRFQLDLLQGAIQQIDDPNIIPGVQDAYVFLSLSRDGGQSYYYKIKAPMGEVGQRTFRTVWRKLGVIPRGQAVVVKIEFFNTIPFFVFGAAWAFEILPE